MRSKLEKGFLKDYYERQAHFLDNHQDLMYEGADAVGKARFEIIMRAIGDLQPANMLDVGCAEGYYISAFRRQNRERYAVGLDLALSYLKKAKEKCPTIDLIEADVEHLPFRDSSFEIVLCSETLEHTVHPKKAFGEIVRVASKYTIVTAPSRSFVFRIPPMRLFRYNAIMARIFGRELSKDPFSDLGPGFGHLQELSLQEMIIWAKELDCRVIKSKVLYTFYFSRLPRKLAITINNLVDCTVEVLPTMVRSGSIQFLLLSKHVVNT